MRRRDFTKMTVLGLLALAAPSTSLADGSLQLSAAWVETPRGLRLRATVDNAGEPVELMHHDGSPAARAMIGDRPYYSRSSMSRVGPRREWLQLAQGSSPLAIDVAEQDVPEAAELTVTLQGREGPIELKATVPPRERPQS